MKSARDRTSPRKKVWKNLDRLTVDQFLKMSQIKKALITMNMTEMVRRMDPPMYNSDSIMVTSFGRCVIISLLFVVGVTGGRGEVVGSCAIVLISLQLLKCKSNVAARNIIRV